MKEIDSGYDDVLNVNYILYSIKYNDLKELVKSWYPDTIFRAFDEQYTRDEQSLIEGKKSGLVCNLFFAYKDGDTMYLLDGFNRLLTNYAQLDVNPVVYLKVITDELPNDKLMGVMFRLNNWKLFSNERGFRYHIVDIFLDRGMRLLLYKKFNIDFYFEEKKVDTEKIGYERDWYNRPYDRDDLCVISYYFKNETEYCGDFYFGYTGIRVLVSNVCFIDDLKDIMNANRYKNEPFKNYKHFLENYCMYLAYHRTYLKNTSEMKFETYLQLLKDDSKFFKKLQGMCGNDSTRKKLYNWFRNLDKK